MPSKPHASSVVVPRPIRPIVCDTRVAPWLPQHQLLPVCAFPVTPEVHSSHPPRKSPLPPPSLTSSTPPIVLPRTISLPQTHSQKVSSSHLLPPLPSHTFPLAQDPPSATPSPAMPVSHTQGNSQSTPRTNAPHNISPPTVRHPVAAKLVPNLPQPANIFPSASKPKQSKPKQLQQAKRPQPKAHIFRNPQPAGKLPRSQKIKEVAFLESIGWHSSFARPTQNQNQESQKEVTPQRRSCRSRQYFTTSLEEYAMFTVQKVKLPTHSQTCKPPDIAHQVWRTRDSSFFSGEEI